MTSMTGPRARGIAGWLARGRFGLALAALSVGLSGCATGAYPLDIFPEMHYQQSFRSQEGPRLEAPIDSVPTKGKPVPVDLGTAGALKSTVANNAESEKQGLALYGRNCAPCHGAQGKGDGFLKKYFETGKENRNDAGQAIVPIDLTGPRGRIWTGGEGSGLYTIISNGQGQWMPSFRALLTDDERWLIVQAVKRLQAQAAPAS